MKKLNKNEKSKLKIKSKMKPKSKISSRPKGKSKQSVANLTKSSPVLNSDSDFMRKAIELSKKNVISLSGGPFGAVVVKDGKIIGRGVNKVTSNNDPTAHAEVEAIRSACKKLNNFDLRGAVIYTSCEPCPMCLSAIYWARIDKIYFGNTRNDAAHIHFDDDLIYSEIPKDPKLRKIPAIELLREEAIEVFELWDKSQRKIAY